MSDQPSDNLYITGLPPDVDDQKLRAIFGAYAEITSTKVLNNPTGQGFCAALCRFASVQAATWIVQSLHGNIPEGLSSPIQVKFANPGGGKGGKEGGGKGGAGMWGAGGMGADGGYGKGGMGGGMGAQGGPYAKQPAPPSDNLYVTGMPSEISQEQVVQIFSGYGTVVSSKLLGAKDGNAAALIRYVSVAEASKVKEMLNGNIPEGLSAPITIRFADQKDPSGGKGGGFAPMGKGPGQQAPPSDNLYITGLPEQCGPQDLSTLFGAFGTVVSSKVLGVKFGKAAAMVRFSSVEEASQVKANMDGQVPPGCEEGIKINFADSAENRAQRKGGKGDDMMAMAMFGGGGGGWAPEFAGGGKGGFGGGGKGKGKDGVDMNAILKAFEESGGLPGSVDKENQIALYISGLPPNCEDVHLYRLFSPFGPIAAKGVRAMMWPDGSCKGFGFVNYLDVMAANAAIESVNGAVLPNGTVMKVSMKLDKGAPKPDGATGMEGLTNEQAQLAMAAAQAEAQLMGQAQA